MRVLRALLLSLFAIALPVVWLWGCGGDDGTTPPPPCTIQITAPTSADCLAGGTASQILWSHGGGGNLKIDLYQGDTFVRTVNPSTPNDGSTSWTVNTGGLPSGTDYHLQLTSLRDEGCTDTSEPLRMINQEDCEFTLIVPDPTGRTQWNQGETVEIQWDSQNTCQNVGIRIMEGLNIILDQITTSYPNTGSYFWTVDAYATGNPQYTFEIYDTEVPDCYARALPNIEGVRECILRFLTPAPGTTWHVGETQAIWWEGNFLDTVKLSLYDSSGIPSFIGVIESPLENEGYYVWDVSTLGHGTGTHFKILIEEVRFSTADVCRAFSGEFSIGL